MKQMTNAAAITALVMAALVPAALIISPVHAQSPSQKDCEAAGGTFSREGGNVSCEISTTSNVGNSDNSQTTTEETYDGSNGTLNNDPKYKESDLCDGPGESTDKSNHCPK